MNGFYYISLSFVAYRDLLEDILVYHVVVFLSPWKVYSLYIISGVIGSLQEINS